MLGILVEKPSAMRNFAKALGGEKGVFNGTDYIIVSARGHLYEFDEPENQVGPALYDKYKVWSLENIPWDVSDFSWKRVQKKGVHQLLSEIRKKLLSCDEIAIATDIDPSGEGQLLAWEIISELKLSHKKISRFYFYDESEKEIQKAFKERKVLPFMTEDGDYKKADFRTKWDMLSMQFTRIATLSNSEKAVIRQGRLKSAMVKMTGDALDAVKNYKKETKYLNKFIDENGVVYSNKDEVKYDSKENVINNYGDCSNVVLDKVETKRTAPPLLYDLSTLSSKLSVYGMKAKDILDIYQKMYESQIVSYPRTDDKVMSFEQFNELLPFVDKIANLVGVDVSLLTHREPRKTHVKNGGSHGANRPGTNVPSSLEYLDATFGKGASLIYTFLAKSYLSMLCEDYVFDKHTGHLEKFEMFKGSVSVPKSLGWKLVLKDNSTNGKKQSDDENNENEEFVSDKGLGTVANHFIGEVVNPKPPTPTMKWLMKELLKADVGTGATRTSTYADVTSTSTKYPLLCENKGKLTLTKYGDMSHKLLKDTYIGDITITKMLYEQMESVGKGTLVRDVGLVQIKDFVIHDRDIMINNAKKAGFNNKGVDNMSEVEKYSGMWNGKNISFKRTWGSYRFSDDECEALLKGETIVLNLLSKKDNKPYSISGKLDNIVYNGHSYVGFKNLGFVSDGSVPKSWSKHEFSEDELYLLGQGKSIYCDDFISRSGKKFSATIRFSKEENKIIPNFE